MSRILVIKHGALGDFVLATGGFRAIRNHHKDAQITLLTTQPMRRFAEMCPDFDEVVIDPKPRFFEIGKYMTLRRFLRGQNFDRCYDLQTSGRTNHYCGMAGNRIGEWVGTAPGCSHFDDDPARNHNHTLERLPKMLAMAGILQVPAPDIGFMQSDIQHFDLPERISLIVPGSAPKHKDKRWPAKKFASLARHLAGIGMIPVLIGGPDDAKACADIKAKCPQSINLCGKTTDYGQIVALARRASLAVGNDTGPMHIIAAAPCPVLTLFSDKSDPKRSAPGGPDAPYIQRASLEALGVDEVISILPAHD